MGRTQDEVRRAFEERARKRKKEVDVDKRKCKMETEELEDYGAIDARFKRRREDFIIILSDFESPNKT